MTTALRGSEAPRLWTEPLRELTPKTSAGFAAIRFAERVCGVDLLPWQRWWLIHALELNEAGDFRYRTVLTLIGRQNGKTFLLKILALFFLYVRRVPLVLGTAQDLKIARESWRGAYDLAAAVPALAKELAPPSRRGLPPGRRDTTGDETMALVAPAGRPEQELRRYVVSAASRGAGRGRSVDLLIMDEVREQRDMLAWAALSKTTIARPNSLKALISNAGDDESVLLNHLRERALADESDDLGLFEWSGPDGCAIDDRNAWAQACPALGFTLAEEAVAESLATDPPEVFRTEVLCQHVRALDVLISAEAWALCADPMISLEPYRGRVVAVLDVAPDGQHASLVAGARTPAGVALDVVAAWTDMRRLAAELPDLLERVRPAVFGWFPGGPAAQLAALLRQQRNAREISGGQVTEACQGFVGAVHRGAVRHGNDPLLTAHVVGAKRFEVSDGYRFVRKGAGHVDAAYAAAGVVALAAEVAEVKVRRVLYA